VKLFSGWDQVLRGHFLFATSAISTFHIPTLPIPACRVRVRNRDKLHL